MLPLRSPWHLLFLLIFCVQKLSAQFLTPEETVKIPPPAEVPTAPVAVPAAPTPTPVVPPPPVPAPAPPPADSEPYFVDLAAYSREKNIILTWHLARGRSIDRRIQLYRFTEEPKVIHDISRGTLIAKLSGEINLYEDVPPGKGTYYYAVFVESVRGLEPASFTLARNLVGPVAFHTNDLSLATKSLPIPQKRDSEEYRRGRFESTEVDSDEEEEEDQVKPTSRQAANRRGINNVIRRTFFRGDYAEAVSQLKPFLRNLAPKVRSKAMFYTGLSLYRLEKYDRALKFFEHPLTKKFYRRNAEFWVEKIMENSR